LKLTITFLLLVAASGFSQEKTAMIDIYFDSGSYIASDKETDKLLYFFSDENIKIKSAEIKGFCDDIGPEDSNAVLSEKRARHAADLLHTHFQFTPASVSGKGEVSLLSQQNIEKIRAHNRRASVVVVYENVEAKASEKDLPVDEGYKTFDDVLAVGDKIIINRLLFEGSRTSFTDPEESEKELLNIVSYFQKNPSVEFQIEGHVCCITHSFKDARNLETGLNNLSKARAQKIYDFFVAKGIPKNRMTHEGYGRRFPRQGVKESLNKRVEIVITKI
jgi:outer membrane protein OmpA-like peptidoglycan-associated protein